MISRVIDAPGWRTPMHADLVFQRIAHDGLVAAIRGAFPPEVALRAAEPAIRNGVTVIELTMNSEQPIAAMQAVKRAFGDAAVVGMGTVLDVNMAGQALDAGADFLVSPSFDADVLAAGRQAEVLTIPGVITPTEAVQAMRAGATLLKLFPIGPLGVDYFRAIRGPLNQVPMMANGGTTDANIGDFIRAGALACGMGSWLTGDGTWPTDEIARRARRLVDLVTAARTGAPPPQRA
jgi:2-dehydro-3-deoxyphosphogluconate aldolase/(4S)-4-hydroxy-2-oxoglutarate aldolase